MYKIYIILFLFKETSCLYLTKTDIPSHAVKGEDLVLQCLYDLQRDSLYSFKWYRNGQEFYRHIPTDIPMTVVFSQPGLTIDEHNSTEMQVVLRNVDHNTSGEFRCEVSGEAPLFQTATHTKFLLVKDLPEYGPEITGSQPMYNPGDILSANCTSYNSFPAATLNWYINGQVALDKLQIHYPEVMGENGLKTSTLGLRLEIEKNLFSKSADLIIKCTATIDPIYWKSEEKLVKKGTEVILLELVELRFSQTIQFIFSEFTTSCFVNCFTLYCVHYLFMTVVLLLVILKKMRSKSSQ